MKLVNIEDQLAKNVTYDSNNQTSFPLYSTMALVMYSIYSIVSSLNKVMTKEK